ncbi:hypothetical protein BBP00_00009803 [Phytophthora kernoviae]|nr:hypothetical protein BBP00_00009803 [Phytophthora kernoviae]
MKADKQHLNEFPNVVGRVFGFVLLYYVRDLYHIPGLKRSVRWDHLKIGVENKTFDAVTEDPFMGYDAAHERGQFA